MQSRYDYSLPVVDAGFAAAVNEIVRGRRELERWEVEARYAEPNYQLPSDWYELQHDAEYAQAAMRDRAEGIEIRLRAYEHPAWGLLAGSIEHREPVAEPHAAPKGDWPTDSHMPTVDEWLLAQHGRDVAPGETVEYHHSSPPPEQFGGMRHTTVYRDADQAAGYTVYSDDGEPVTVYEDPIEWDSYPSDWDTPIVREAQTGRHEWVRHGIEGYAARTEEVSLHMLEWLLDAECIA